MTCSLLSSKESSPRSLASSSVSSASLRLDRTGRTVAIACVAPALVFATGCVRTVLVPETSPVRLAEPVKARVWIMENGTWTRSANSVELKEGLYIVPPSYVDE